MPAFEFRSLDQNGKVKKGVVEADSARQARQQIKSRGWVPLEVNPSREAKEPKGLAERLSLTGRLKLAEQALVTRQLATLIRGGLPVEQALSAVARQTELPRVERIVLGVRSRVMEGFGLAASMAEFPRAFPELYRATVAAGEQSGHLEQVLEQLADYLETRQDTGRSVSQAMIYPAFIMGFSVLVIIFLMSVVVPKMAEVFNNMDQELPLLTRITIGASEFVQNWLWLMALTAVVAVVAFSRAMANPAFRHQVHVRLLGLPLVGGLIRTADSARLAGTLAILSRSGVPLVEALSICSEVVGNLAIRRSVADATRQVREGGSLSKALERSGWFSPMLVQMIASGEQSGELEQMLLRAADYQERNLSNSVQAMVNLLGPVMLLLMAGVVMLVVLSVILPMLNLNSFAS